MKKILLAIGAILVLLVVAVVVVPALVDWSRYKDEIVARLEQATGREVTIAGDVGLSLLPTPAFTAERITIGNIPEAGDRPFAEARELSIRLDPLPLLSGEIAVESVVLTRPQVNLTRLSDGRVNWQFTPVPEASGSAGPDSPAETTEAGSDGMAVSIGQFRIDDGTIAYREGDGNPTTIESVDARIEAGSMAGPFAFNGDLALGAIAVEFQGVLDRIHPERGSPFRLTVQLPAAEAKGNFSGMLSQLSGGPTLRGRLSVSGPDLARLARLAAPEAATTLPTNAPFAAEANLSASADGVQLADLTATLGDARATGNLSVGLAGTPQIDVALSVASLDLDKWLPPTAPAPVASSGPPPPPPVSNTLPGTGPGPSPAPGFTLPANLFIDANLAIDTLSYRGQVVQDARLEATLAERELILHGLTARLPGGSVASVAGVLMSADGRPVFDGQAEARSDNFRALLAWLGTDSSAIPADRLRRLEASAGIRAAWPEIELRDLSMQLDATTANGGLTARLTERPGFGLALRVGALNLDAYRPVEQAPAATTAPAGAAGPQSPAPKAEGSTGAPLEALTGFDADVDLVVDRLTLNGVQADAVGLTAVLNNGDLVVKRAGASLAGTDARLEGRVLGLSQASPRVENLLFTIASPQPSRLFAFLGIDAPASVGRLGQLTATGRLDGDWQSIALDANLSTGALQASVQGTLADPLAAPRYQLTVKASSPTFAQLSRVWAPSYRPAGNVGPVDLTARITGGRDMAEIPELTAGAGPVRVTGNAQVAFGAGKPAVTANLTANAIVLDPFLPADRTGFLLPVPGGLRVPPGAVPGPAGLMVPVATGSGNPWSREPLELAGLEAANANIQFSAPSVAWRTWVLEQARTHIVLQDGILANTINGRLLGGQLSFDGKLGSAGVPSLTGVLDIQGANLSGANLGAGGIAVTQGRLNAQTRFATTGRSSYDMAQNLKGTGSVLATDGIVSGFDLPAVNKQLQNIRNIGSVLGLLQSALQGGQTRFSKLAGTLVAESGTVTTRDLRLDAEGGYALAEAIVRLPPWSIEAVVALHLADSQTPPALVRLQGPLDNPRKIIDVNALQQHLVARGLGRALGGKDAGQLIEGLLGGGARQAAPQQGQPGDQPPAEEKPSGKRILEDLLKGLGGR